MSTYLSKMGTGLLKVNFQNSALSTHVFKMVNYTVKVVLNRRRRSKTFRIVSLFDQIATQLPIYKRNKILAVV